MDTTLQKLQTELVEQLRPFSETPSLDVQVLLAHALGKPRTWVLSHPEVSLTHSQIESIHRSLGRLLRGEPLPYIIGHWEFFGLDFKLTPDVLIPRPETELLVERAIRWLKLHPGRRNAIDVGTGSGCIAISLAKNIPDLHLVVTDISAQALEVARENAKLHGVSPQLDFKQTDLMSGIPGPFDLICANLPYIPTETLSTLAVAHHEPASALDGGLSGTELIGRLLDQGRHQLTAGGLVLMEVESAQGDEVKTLAQSLYPLSKVSIVKDLAARDRCLEIERPYQLVHLCPRPEWLQAQQNGTFRDASFEQAGFIHCSQPEQVLAVANRFYRGFSDLVVLWLDPTRLVSDIRWEPADGALFPHIYGPINLESVTSISEMLPDQDGVFRTIRLPG